MPLCAASVSAGRSSRAWRMLLASIASAWIGMLNERAEEVKEESTERNGLLAAEPAGHV